MSYSWRCRLCTAVVTVMCMMSGMNAGSGCSDDLRPIGPIISPCQKEIILQKGQNYTLTCKGKTPVQIKQQEVPEEVIGDFRMVQRNMSGLVDEYKFGTILDLFNVDQYAIGYYACFDDTVNGTDILNNLVEEPNNTEHITFIYIYVNGSGSLFAPMREVIVPRQQCKVVIECRPTTPDIEVTLISSQKNRTPEQIKYSPKIGFLMRTCSRSAYKCEGRRGNESKTETKNIRNVRVPPEPRIEPLKKFFLKGESFSINCTVDYKPDSVVYLHWKYPPNVAKESIIESSNEFLVAGKILYKHITVVNATDVHNGKYTCVASNNCGEKENSSNMIYLAEPLLDLIPDSDDNRSEHKQRTIKQMIRLKDYPRASYHALRNGKPLPKNPSKYNVTRHERTGDIILTIFNSTVTDSANYTIVASNSYLTKSHTYDIRVIAPPTVDFGPDADKKYMKGTTASLKCVVTGYPLPDVTWIFSNGVNQTMKSSSIETESVYKETAILNVPVHASVNISCQATNKQTAIQTRRLLVYEMPNGFGIEDTSKTWFYQNQDVTITCIASKYDFRSVTWIGSDEEDLNGTAAVEYTTNTFSYIAKLRFPQISINQSGPYICRGQRLNGVFETELINITVASLQPPIINNPAADENVEVVLFQQVDLNCQAEGVPPPKLEWYKDDVLMSNDTNAKIIRNDISRTVVNSTISIDRIIDANKGVYQCVATSTGDGYPIASRTYTITLKEPSYAVYLSGILAVILILILAVMYLTWKVRKEKRFRKELAAAGLLYFKEGVTKSLNPELGIDEQAELLPYNEKFEFPIEKLKLGIQLGAGAFGVVYKAEARGIVNAEETTEVAVKMVKKTADNMYIKALASELKIMVHLGKHINIVNLLGACTKNVGKRELAVIVEYCKFGNIHNYMLRHREVFIDQLTDNKEKNLGRVNRGFSCSSGSTGAQSDYFGSSTQDTDHTFVNTANTNRSTRNDNPTHQVELLEASESYVQPEWRSNYESDYCFDGRNPRPLTSRDLLVWAFQIARGMEYLASRKVRHGDLAARNVLLAEDNIVKICDFGLATSVYKSDEYQQKENCPLPFKWLAIECMESRIFSTQSDVWSFGIVLWELFSLAKTPYPNMGPADLLSWLSSGNRLARPTYADQRLHDVMLRCWDQKPTNRPSFSELQEILGGFLEDNVRNHYVDLNTAYTNMNPNPGGEDYLAMVMAPDYNNLTTPSPRHEYANDRNFFPNTPTQIDEQGYLQMSPASRQNSYNPRAQDPKFDFDARKFNPRVSEASSCGSELTPMLTLNNLPARSGSESDHEGNSSPYLNMCPRIDEETDDVFETNQKNALNTAVTNPTYISLDIGDEKKPKDIINSYINIPNGLVK
ncbi:vascular endothelial growth factor receptor 1 isoform X2 [Helicoverpa armigera]|uniref:vascular endothelial growth factor receptor 1 isoform X2 n=2 Tax=Helicoverpa armigera TaxID=29058 RepID=UPI0030827901